MCTINNIYELAFMFSAIGFTTAIVGIFFSSRLLVGLGGWLTGGLLDSHIVEEFEQEPEEIDIGQPVREQPAQQASQPESRQASSLPPRLAGVRSKRTIRGRKALRLEGIEGQVTSPYVDADTSRPMPPADSVI